MGKSPLTGHSGCRRFAARLPILKNLSYHYSGGHASSHRSWHTAGKDFVRILEGPRGKIRVIRTREGCRQEPFKNLATDNAVRVFEGSPIDDFCSSEIFQSKIFNLKRLFPFLNPQSEIRNP